MLAIALVPARAEARRHRFRTRFEPRTLDLEDPGVLTIDGEFGAFYGDGEDGGRISAPDLELGLALTERLELGLEAGLTVTQLDTPDKQLSGDPLWPTLIATLIGVEDEEKDAFGLGIQAGPRLPSVGARDALGVAGLVLLGGGTPRVQVIGNVGATYDRSQTAAILFGVDLQVALDGRGRFAFLADVGGLYAFGGEPAQLIVDVGASWDVTDALELSLLALAGPVFEGDRVGVLFGIERDFSLW